MKWLLIGGLMLVPPLVRAQNSLDPAAQQAIDKIFSEYGHAGKPALAVAAIKGGKLVFQKVVGQANLEYKVPATADTRFHVNAQAWEFVAFAILNLEDQGKLSLSDDVRTYLPEVPDFGKKISINHLLSSTDGLYSYSGINALTGSRSKEVDQVGKIPDYIKHQKRLNFAPGEVFSVRGDTRFVLLKKIVEVVSGQSFEAYSKAQIFDPLGMVNTIFLAAPNPSLENLATPYALDGSGKYQLSQGEGNAAGMMNLYSSLRDMTTWRQHVRSHKLASKLQSPLKLDNGAPIRGMAGVSIYGQQHFGQERGIPKTFQAGSFGGYTSVFFGFPGHDMTVITLGSGGGYNGRYGMNVAYQFLPGAFPEPETIDYTKIEGVKMSPAELQKYEGKFWNAKASVASVLHMKGNVLHYNRVGGAVHNELIPLSDTVFQMKVEGDDTLLLKFVEGKHGRQMHYSVTGSDPMVFESYRPATYSKSELAQFTGSYFSKELNTSYEFEENQGVLSARNLHAGSVSFEPVHADLFHGNKAFLSGVQFVRKNGVVTGFQVMVDGVRHLEFRKLRS
ncbi:serine hydrolase [Roseateles sp. DAIF2]|uniref:serine hydrolase domain-containing protein n=1 Tax=Roseateles sp. DAIF2 TaxID=2714952 RepID=UPI0018A2705D|nr:serine hydrolase domain-containing protein [Roseateles sp. DAIF2]QPF75147.1 serine hydrolase [Roseateles sp. DAIF2]